MASLPGPQMCCCVQAAKYQIVIVLLAVTGSVLAASAAVVMTVYTAIDATHRLRADSLVPRRGRDAGVAQWVHAQTVKVPVISTPADIVMFHMSDMPDLQSPRKR